jgi:farnesyl diphosphate synthase
MPLAIIDILAENQTLDYNEIVRLQRMKTGALFATSCEAGAILGRGARNLRNSLRAYANNIGLAFQITDDLLDAEGTREESGKTVRKDAVAGKATLVSTLGPEQARQQAKLLANQAVDHLSPFGEKADLLRELANFVVSRHK